MIESTFFMIWFLGCLAFIPRKRKGNPTTYVKKSTSYQMAIFQYVKFSLFAQILFLMYLKPSFCKQLTRPERCLFCVYSLPEMFKKISFLIFIASGFSLISQETLNQHIVNQLSALYKEEYDRKKEIKIDGKRYRIYNNYVTIGAGKGYNSGWQDVLFTPAIDFNFHLKKTCFQTGGMLQGQSYGNNQLIQFHVCAGYRKESYKYFWAIYGGLSYTDGYNPIKIKDRSGSDSATILGHFKETGLYVAAQAFYKVKFDYGIGLTLFGDVNARQSMVGARIELFFSGAFRGNLHHKDEE